MSSAFEQLVLLPAGCSFCLQLSGSLSVDRDQLSDAAIRTLHRFPV